METIRVNPDKASEDGRDYRALQLPNKLKVILVSDPSTDKSGAALDVHVGHLSGEIYFLQISAFTNCRCFVCNSKSHLLRLLSCNFKFLTIQGTRVQTLNF